MPTPNEFDEFWAKLAEARKEFEVELAAALLVVNDLIESRVPDLYRTEISPLVFQTRQNLTHLASQLDPPQLPPIPMPDPSSVN